MPFKIRLPCHGELIWADYESSTQLSCAIINCIKHMCWHCCLDRLEISISWIQSIDLVRDEGDYHSSKLVKLKVTVLWNNLKIACIVCRAECMGLTLIDFKSFNLFWTRLFNKTNHKQTNTVSKTKKKKPLQMKQ